MGTRREGEKPPILAELDKFCDGTSPPQREKIRQARERIRKGEAGTAIIAVGYSESVKVLSPENALHLLQDWFHSYWPEAQPVAPQIRVALMEASRLVNKHKTSLNSDWQENEETDIVSVTVSYNKDSKEVDFTIWTPPPPRRRTKSGSR